MRNYDYWKERKRDNKNKIILFLSWMFYRTFESDARVLSDRFWFKIKVSWWYEQVWFPKNSLDKYLSELSKNNIWYLIYEKWDNDELQIIKDINWASDLKFNNKNLIYLENKLKKINNNKDNFQYLLDDLEKLILKYR